MGCCLRNRCRSNAQDGRERKCVNTRHAQTPRVVVCRRSDVFGVYRMCSFCSSLP